MLRDHSGAVMARRSLSIDEARRIAIGAQGLDRPGDPSSVDIRHLRRALSTIGVLQLDFVNVLIPAHYLILYARVGAYDPACLHRLVYGRGEFIEHWAHEASIVPAADWALLEYRRRRYKPWPGSPITKLKGLDKYLQQIIEIIENNGPVCSQDLPPVPGPKRRPGDWHRSVPRWALDVHFGRGALAVKERLPNFQRVYDLPDRLIASRHLERQVDEVEAYRELLLKAAQASGVATLQDLADYYRMSPRDVRPRLAELVDAGMLTEVDVDGWKDPAYIAKGTRKPRQTRRSTLLSPFDPLVWYRPRAERLFDFHYRIEIYVPEKKRRWGYYVLPFLVGDRIVARVDLKADRIASTLHVRAAWLEEHADPALTAERLAAELKSLADWLCLEQVNVGRRGNLSTALRTAIRAANIHR